MTPLQIDSRQAKEPARDYHRIGVRISEKLALHDPNLTKRERLVCGFALAGYAAEEISLMLGIGTSTIITYRRRAYSRLGISNVHLLISATN